MATREGTPYLRWREQVDTIVQEVADVSLDDLADFPSRDWFDSEMSPRAAAIQVLRDEGFDFDEEDVA